MDDQDNSFSYTAMSDLVSNDTFKPPPSPLPHVSFIQNLCQNGIQFFPFVLGII